ncbi:hypothetical protein AMR41_08705 [Hapalosiphon sp. MRB220]|nr:hypothetical protein AMR41_08705 [Hapalosiphon sp. MRB220]
MKIDLAKVNSQDIFHHYANQGTQTMSSGVYSEYITDPGAMKLEELRAGKTAIRNREIHLNKYPASAVVGGIQDSPGVINYKNAYTQAYNNAYKQAYNNSYSDGYTEAFGSSSKYGENYVHRDQRHTKYRYNYTYRDNGVNYVDEHGKLIDAGSRDGWEDGRKDSETTPLKKNKN